MNKNGFTLVELIGVVILIGLIALIAIPSVDYIITKTKSNAYNRTLDTLKDCLRNWGTDNKELIYEDGEEIIVTLSDLKEQGYVEYEIKNPKTSTCLANTMQFKITRVKDTEKDTYEYTFLDDELLDGNLKDCEAVSKTPSIYLLGDNPQKIEITNDSTLTYASFDPGATAKSSQGEDMSSSIVKTNNVNLKTLSKDYHAKYTVIENGISKTVTRKVYVVDTTAPELNVPDDIEIEIGESLNLMEGVTATDNSGVAPTIKTSGHVNFNKEGEYKVIYIATDKSGNSTQKERIIKITKGNAILETYNSGTSVTNGFRSSTYRNKIVSMSFIDNIKAPADSIKWDLSEAKDESIIGWLVESTSNPGYYNMYIGSNSNIQANPNSSRWFYNLQSLIEIDFSNFKTELVTNMSYMFSGSKVNSLDLGGFDTSNVTDMSSKFNGVKTTELNLSSFETSNVTNMGFMFSGSDIIELDLRHFDTSEVTNMGYLFGSLGEGCADYNQAETLILGDWDTSNTTNMGGMFSCFNSLETLDVSNLDTQNVTDMSAMFMRNSAKKIHGLTNFNTQNVKTMNSMFFVSQADNVTVTSFDTSNVTNMGWMFCANSTKNMDLSNFNTSNVTDMENMFGSSNILALDLSRFDTSKVIYMNQMFENAKTTSLTGLNNFNTSNVKYMDNMFYNLKATAIDVSNFDTSNVINMSLMFGNTIATTLDVSDFNTSSATNMYGMFYSSKASVLDVSKFNTSNVTNMRTMFYRTSASTIDCSNFDASSTTTIREMFNYANATTIKTPKNIPTTVDMTNITSYAFTGSDGNTYAKGTFPTGNTASIILTR